MFLSPLGVPLTLLQFAVQPTHEVAPLLVVNNFLLGSAIYDADRLDSSSSAQALWTCRFSAFASMLIYGTNADTLWLSPIVLALHLAYADIKPYIGPIKPFFVALFWTIAVYYAPLWWTIESGDVFTPTAFFLHIAALSHAADVKDAVEDENNGILTPAVTMSEDLADAYSIALGFAACFLHASSPVSNIAYDIVFLGAIAATIFVR